MAAVVVRVPEVAAAAGVCDRSRLSDLVVVSGRGRRGAGGFMIVGQMRRYSPKMTHDHGRAPCRIPWGVCPGVAARPGAVPAAGLRRMRIRRAVLAPSGRQRLDN